MICNTAKNLSNSLHICMLRKINLRLRLFSPIFPSPTFNRQTSTENRQTSFPNVFQTKGRSSRESEIMTSRRNAYKLRSMSHAIPSLRSFGGTAGPFSATFFPRSSKHQLIDNSSILVIGAISGPRRDYPLGTVRLSPLFRINFATSFVW